MHSNSSKQSLLIFNSQITYSSTLCTQLQTLSKPVVHSAIGAFPSSPKYRKQSLHVLSLVQDNKNPSTYPILSQKLSLRLTMTQLFIAFLHTYHGSWTMGESQNRLEYLSKEAAKTPLTPIYLCTLHPHIIENLCRF